MQVVMGMMQMGSAGAARVRKIQGRVWSGSERAWSGEARNRMVVGRG